MSASSHSQAPVIVGGTIAIDHVKTPEAEAADLLGGSAAYAALAASFFSRPVSLVGIIGHDFPQQHLDMLESRGVSLDGVERSSSESFTWSGEYHTNMNERTTHRVGLNVLENWQVKVPSSMAAAPIVVLANMSPDNQIEMLSQCGIGANGNAAGRFVVADTMDLWIEIANGRLHEVLPQLDLFVLNEGEARELAAHLQSRACRPHPVREGAAPCGGQTRRVRRDAVLTGRRGLPLHRMAAGNRGRSHRCGRHVCRRDGGLSRRAGAAALQRGPAPPCDRAGLDPCFIHLRGFFHAPSRIAHPHGS